MAGDALDHAQRQGVHVGAAVQGSALGLLRRRVTGRANHPTTTKQFAADRAGQSVGEAEVGDAESGILAKQQVGRLHVPVNDALPVSVIQSPAGLESHHEHLGRGQRPA